MMILTKVMPAVALAGIWLLVPAKTFSRPLDETPVFEAADVHRSAQRADQAIRGGNIRGGRYEIQNATMLDLIRLAYDIDAGKVIGTPPWLDSDRGDRVMEGPVWLDWDRFDIIARVPAGSRPQELTLMLRALLVERFQLKLHDDRRPIPGYVLTVGTSLKLKKAESSDLDGCRQDARGFNPGSTTDHMYTCHNVTMASFAQSLRGMATEYLGGAVVDGTGLDGGWDFNIAWSERGRPGSGRISIFSAIEKQLGLKLEQQDHPTAVIVVDHVNRSPTANPPGVTQKLNPGSPEEFEVASVKSSPPGLTAKQFRVERAGRLDIRAAALSELIVFAWDITPDTLAGAPNWLDTERFDIVAKVPSDGAASMQSADMDRFRPMLRALLVERFKLATHTEDRPVSVYALMPGSREPPLTKADPAARATCRYTVLPSGSAGSSPLTSGYSCQNVTMVQLAEKMRSWAPGYLDHSILDLTGIEGGWDFVLRWTPLRNLRGIGMRGGSFQSADGTASDPYGGMTIFEAVEKQLGLRLRLQKHTTSTLVVDHVEHQPTDN